MKRINQKMHEWLGKIGLLKDTNCIERGCNEYHGRSPSQLMRFAFHHYEKSFYADKQRVNNVVREEYGNGKR